MPELNATHDPARRSWVAFAAAPQADFPIQNLPFGRFRRPGGAPQGGVAIGRSIVDLAAVLEAGLLPSEAQPAASAATGEDLLPLLRAGTQAASTLRAALSELLRDDGPLRARAEAAAERLLVPADAVELLLTTAVRQFSDMCVSTFHIGRRAGNDERGESICPPVLRTLPVGYDGRASSLIVSGTPVRRPNGLWTATVEGGGDPQYGPEPRQDYELEMGCVAGRLREGAGRPHFDRDRRRGPVRLLLAQRLVCA